ncbi:MAG: hypothetical protein AB4063_22150 [Crocosphaera sp.]
MSRSTLNSSLDIPKESLDNRFLLIENSYISTLVNYVASSYQAGEISYNTCEYLIREFYSYKIEQMIEKKVEQQLDKIMVRLNRYD